MINVKLAKKNAKNKRKISEIIFTFSYATMQEDRTLVFIILGFSIYSGNNT